jgi:phage shock protein C
MKAAVTVELDGSTFVLDAGAYQALLSYLDRASARLANHPDRDDVLLGLERSIAAKLARGPAAEGMPLDEGEMRAALREVGRVDGPELGADDADVRAASSRGGASGAVAAPRAGAAGATGSTGASAGGPGSARVRRLYRLKEGQQIAGVCAGLAAFAEIDVSLIRVLFLIGALFSGGVLLVGYVVLAFLMPIARTEVEIAEARGGGTARMTRE